MKQVKDSIMQAQISQTIQRVNLTLQMKKEKDYLIIKGEEEILALKVLKIFIRDQIELIPLQSTPETLTYNNHHL